MKYPILFVLIVLLFGLAGCSAMNPADQARVAQELTDATTALKATSAELKATAAVLPPAQAAGVTKAANNVDKATPVVAGAANAASQPGASPVDVAVGGLGAIIPFIPPPYQQDAQLGLLAITAAGAIWRAISNGNKAATANAANASLATGLQTALATGAIVAKPNAAETVDAAFTTDHPVANTVYNALSVAAGNFPVKG